MDIKELQVMQALPLELKVAKTKARLMDAIRTFGTDGLYLSLSGGKDSLVLHWICKELEYELYGGLKIPRVFCNTGLEYPEVREKVERLFEGESVKEYLVVLKPKMHFRDVITKYGYPIISKEQSQFIHQYRNAKSEPIGFWTEQDILCYIYENNISIPSVYGEVLKIDDKYELTGVTRTGCVFCAYGVHLEKGENRFQRMKRTHPNLYNYCMNGGKFDEEGNWIPDKGLGMRKVLATIKVNVD